MWRSFPTEKIQLLSRELRNQVCPLGTSDQMAKAASHLRNFAVGEVIGFIALLDGHPAIKNPPTVAKSGAAYQQTTGTRPNPFTHVVPSNLLLDGENLVNYYRSLEARNALERVFGMGVMAPDKWEDEDTFDHSPRQHNVVDNIAERYHYGGGLADAFKACAEAAVQKGKWDGSGKRRYEDLPGLSRFIAEIYAEVWVPNAARAYFAARSHFAGQLPIARKSDPARASLIEQRQKILEGQIEQFETESTVSPEAAKNVWKFTASETWV
jgi:hypothetical protein